MPIVFLATRKLKCYRAYLLSNFVAETIVLNSKVDQGNDK